MKRWLFILLLSIVSIAHGQTINLCSNTYTVHATVNLTWSSGSKKITFIGDSINAGNTYTPCIQLAGYDTVIIKHCKLMNSKLQAVLLTDVKYSVVDSNYMANVSDGVHDNISTYDAIPGGIIFTNNYIKNILGPFPLGNAIQLNKVHAHGVLIANNYVECIDSVGRHPQDIFSIYKSSGFVGDSIMVINNYIKGGQVNNDSGGAAGIVLNDVGGSYQVARGNILVNPGAVGIQVQGGHGSKVDHNKIYGDGHGAISFEGIQYGNYSSDSTYAIEMSYNKVYWKQTSGSVFNRWVDKAIAVAASTISGHAGGGTLPDPIGWTTNTAVTAIDTSIKFTMLPSTLLSTCSAGPIAPIITYPSSLYTFIVNASIGPLIPSNTGTPATTTWTASGLPTGLNIDAGTGIISGTPTVLGSNTYTITATNIYGSGIYHITMSVIPIPAHISMRKTSKVKVLP